MKHPHATTMALHRDLDALDELAQTCGSAVVLTHPARRDDLMSLGRALRWSLRGETRSFTALVGYFHHKPEVGRDEDERGELEDDDPARIILREAQEESLRLVEPDHDFESSGFNLLAGLLCSRPAAVAARLWYWTCRWRAQAPDGPRRSDAYRKRFLERASLLASQGAARPFETACLELLDPVSPHYDGSPGPIQLADALPGSLECLEGEGLVDLERYWQDMRHTLDLEDEAPEDVGASIGVLEHSSGMWKAAALLYGFLLQRKGAFKVTPRRQSVRIDDRVVATLATFHPKIYLVERAGAHHDTVSFVGSNNWSDKAVGAVWTNAGEVVGNVEVATAHVSRGHGWSDPGDSDELGERVCGVARYIYDSVGEVVGDWCDPSAELVDVARLHNALAVYTETSPREYLETPEASLYGDDAPVDPPEDPEPSLLEELAPELTAIIERVLGLENPQQLSVIRDLSSGEERTLFGGREPSRYQLDGAIRLLSMLRTGDPARRGAFLTDEAGLGKTLAAKLCATQLIMSRLLTRFRAGGSYPTLCVSLIAPARLVGEHGRRDEDVSTGWHGHAREIVEAVEAALAEMRRRDDELGREGGGEAPVRFPDEAERAVLMESLCVRVLSAGGFPRELLEERVRPVPVILDGLELKRARKASDPVGDLAFVARSEVVVIDESHTFRNDTSYGTRALRFALSLPCPGEDWPLIWDGSPPQEAEEGALVAQRRILCLSATPFNNRLEDLLTQIGHFSHVQDWSLALRNDPTQISLNQTPLEQALSGWRALDSAAPEEHVRELFEVLLLHAYRHLRSTRKLSEDPDKMAESARDQKVRRILDGGPDYVWPPCYAELHANLIAVSAWVRQRDAGEDEPDVALTREARARLDALLCDLMVQRSRSRALKLTEASDSSVQIDQMFRRPRVPRYPLSLNEADRSGTSFEARVLRDLYTLLGNEIEEDPEQLEDGRLDLFGYRLSTLRARLPYGHEGASEEALEQTIQNNLGFQKITLVKRLQSSPYAFLRTILRGLLRRTLFELALLERLLAPLRLQTGDPAEAALENHALIDVFRDVVAALDVLHRDLQLSQRAFISPVTQILDGVRPGGRGHFLCELGGFYTPDADREVPDAPMRERFEVAYEALRDALGLGEEGAFDETAYTRCWANRLVEDVAGGERRSRLLHDVGVIMQWTFAPRGSELVQGLYTELEAVVSGGTPLYAAPFDVLKGAFMSPPADLLGHTREVRVWLESRLEADSRLRALIAWLALQRLAHDELGTSLSGALPGGHRSLIFSEYTDTQEYVLAVLAALDLCLRESAPGFERLVHVIASEVVTLTGRLDEAAEQVRASVQAPPKDRYLSPVVMDAVWSHELLGGLERNEDGALTRLTGALGRLASRVGRVSAAESARLGESSASLRDESDHPGAPDDEGSVGGGHVVEAFSPWYQIAPPKEPGERAEGLQDKLELASRAPVDVLFATEVLSEGVNLQECGVVVHYDLPWNPTRLIQRNGRVDRRVFDLYERPFRLDALRASLAPEGQPGWRGPELLVPRQVYHMTLLPTEPEDVELTERVRERLFDKLDTIRALFGLSYWPVVFNQEQAREVLSGELDYETPGFRRREELFSHWGAVSPLVGKRSTVRTGSFTLHMGEAMRTRLASRMRDLPEDDPEIVTPGWRALARAGVVSWSPGLRNTVTVRSAPEASRMLLRNGQAPGRSCALSGVLVLPDVREGFPVDATRQLTWALEPGTRSFLTAAWLEVDPTGRDEGDLDELFVAQAANLDELSGASPDYTARLGAPASPTAVAEEVLTCLVDALLEGDPMRWSHQERGYQPEDPGGAFMGKAAPWRAHLAHPLELGAMRDGLINGHLRGSLAQMPRVDDPGALPNIWIELHQDNGRDT